MKTNTYKLLLLITLIFSQVSWLSSLYYPNDFALIVYTYYIDNKLVVEEPLFIYLSYYAGMALMAISTIGMLLFWSIARVLFIFSFFLIVPGYFTQIPLLYSPIMEILYDLSMIGSGVILSVSFLEPINSFYIKKANK